MKPLFSVFFVLSKNVDGDYDDGDGDSDGDSDGDDDGDGDGYTSVNLLFGHQNLYFVCYRVPQYFLKLFISISISIYDPPSEVPTIGRAIYSDKPRVGIILFFECP